MPIAHATRASSRQLSERKTRKATAQQNKDDIRTCTYASKCFFRRRPCLQSTSYSTLTPHACSSLCKLISTSYTHAHMRALKRWSRIPISSMCEGHRSSGINSRKILENSSPLGIEPATSRGGRCNWVSHQLVAGLFAASKCLEYICMCTN